MSYTRNFTLWARRATPEHWQQGRLWYYDAHDYCQGLVGKYTLEQVVGCVAALSPQTEWEHNKRVARGLIEGITLPYSGYKANMEKAKACLEGNPLDILGGLKVRAFYDNILAPRTSELVTVDSHMIRIFLGRFELTRKDTNFAFRRYGNTLLQNALRSVASRFEVRPHELQATLWLAVKEHYESV